MLAAILLQHLPDGLKRREGGSEASLCSFEGVWSKHLNPTRPRSDTNVFPPTAAGRGPADDVWKPLGRGRNDTFLLDGETRSQLTARLVCWASHPQTHPSPPVTRA